MPRKIGLFTRQAMVKRYEAGESTIMLAAAYGVSVSTVRFNLEDAGVTLRTREEARQLRTER